MASYLGETAQAPPETAISRMEQTLDNCVQRLGNLEVGLEHAADRLYGSVPREAKNLSPLQPNLSEPLSRRIDAVREALDRVERAAVRLDHGN